MSFYSKNHQNHQNFSIIQALHHPFVKLPPHLTAGTGAHHRDAGALPGNDGFPWQLRWKYGGKSQFLMGKLTISMGKLTISMGKLTISIGKLHFQ